MASSGGGNIPSPPKRPTVIRRSEGPVVPGRPAPPVPSSKPTSKPSEAHSNGTEPTDIPSRPSVVLPPRPAPSQPAKPPDNAVKKRPVITIVSARPMSEVGFRDDAPPKPPVTQNTDTSPRLPSQPPPPPPRPSSTMLENEERQHEDECDKARNTPLAPAQRPHIPPSVPSRTAMPPVKPQISPRMPSNDSVQTNSGLSGSGPPPIPKRLYDLDDESLCLTSDVVPPTEFNKPKRPTIVGRPAPVKSPRAEVVDESGDTNRVESDVKNLADEKSEPPVASRPKRPTIIRPGRPSEIKKENSDDSINVSAPSVPEFMTARLKPTVSPGEEKPSVEDSNEHLTTSHRGPPPPPKPKPSVLPKPSLAPKPEVARKPVLQQSPELKQSVGNIEQDSSPEKDSPESKKPPVLSKRPTIIRPSRNPVSPSSENLAAKAEVDESQVTMRRSNDDTEILKHPSRPQPPLPSKRPVSMTNIPQAIVQELSMTQSFNSSQTSSQSSENVNTPQHSSAPPRPVARTRPASMMVPSLRPPPPSVRPRSVIKEDISQSLSASRSAEDVTVDPTPAPAPQKKFFGVAVLPQPNRVRKESQEDLSNQNQDTKEPDKETSNQKPATRPPPPKAPRQVGEPPKQSSSSEDEFFMSQTKPDRPPVPRPAKLHHEEDKKAPARPGVPPPAKRNSLSDSPEKDVEELPMRPKPVGRPPRPVSVSAKGEPPVKPKPPRPGSVKKKTDTPSLPARPGPGHPLYHYMMQTPHGVALHDYAARHDDELTFKMGDVILLLQAVDSEWIKGQLGEQEGIFPRGFVKVKMPLPGETMEEEESSEEETEMFYDATTAKPDHIGHGPRCRARFDFDGEGQDDLTFEEGDVIRLLERVGLEWRRGECDGRTGLFPLGFVEVIEDLPEDGASDSQSTDVRALFDFEGEANELCFQADETIHVQYRVNEEWLFGQIGERTGQFPIQFVDHVPTDLPPLPKESTVHTLDTEPLPAWQDEEPSMDVHDSSSMTPDVDPSSPHCVAVYDYPGPDNSDLTFSEGDVIQIVERIDENWLKGSLNGITGMFPVEFVQIKVDLQGPSNTEDGPPGKLFGVALHEFSGEADNELTFNAGDQIELYECVQGAEDWRWGVIAGNRGMFPTAFVEEI